MEEILRMEVPSISEESGNMNFKMKGGYKLLISRACNFLLRIYMKLFYFCRRQPYVL